MNTSSFSKRYGYNVPSEVEITVRQDAPHELRGIIIHLAYEAGLSPNALRIIICKVLRKRPDKENWTEYPNIDDENHYLINGCLWYKVYDILESIYKEIEEISDSDEYQTLEEEINNYFIESGVGWKLKEGLIESRGSEVYESIIKKADDILSELERDTARNELHEAVSDISRRPNPDITGAIQHSMASLECVAREACGDRNATLGEIIKHHKDLIPAPLDQAITKAWGYASGHARHIQEGNEPSYDEAELIVGICASVSTYLSSKEKA